MLREGRYDPEVVDTSKLYINNKPIHNIVCTAEMRPTTQGRDAYIGYIGIIEKFTGIRKMLF